MHCTNITETALLMTCSCTTCQYRTTRGSIQICVDEWVATIRAEEALATPDHAMVAMEHWDAAHFREQDAHANAAKAREAYKNGLRGVNYGI